MTISVTSSGPIIGGVTVPSIGSATLGTMLSAISDDIDDTTGEYSNQIATAILSAIRFCERETYYFNETRDVTFSTVDGQEFYTSVDNAAIATLVHIESAWKEDTAGQRTAIRRVLPDDIELLADANASRGEPYCWSYFAQKVRLYPVPSVTVFTIRLVVAPYRLDPLTAVDSTNAWLTEAYDMIKARAKYILAMDTLKDPPVATAALADYNNQRQFLLAETSSRNGTGTVQATSF